MKLLKFVFIFILLNSCGNAINEKSASTKKVLPSKQKKTLNKKSNVNKKKEIIGAIGVIGPMRINYAKIIPVVDYTAKLIGEKFEIK